MNKEVKEICMKCELEFHKRGKGCAFRSLGNEYCDLIEDFNKSITNYQNQVEKLTQENNDLENIYIIARDNLSKSLLENADLKERIGYLERSNNRKEETIIELRKEQELDKYKSVIDKAIEFIEENKIFYSGLQNEDLEIGLFENEIKDLLEILRSKE